MLLKQFTRVASDFVTYSYFWFGIHQHLWDVCVWAPAWGFDPIKQGRRTDLPYGFVAGKKKNC